MVRVFNGTGSDAKLMRKCLKFVATVTYKFTIRA